MVYLTDFGYTPEDYAEPVQTIKLANCHNPLSDNSSPTEHEPSHIYTNPHDDLPHSTLSMDRQQNAHHYSMVTEEETTADLPVGNYSQLEHSLSQRSPTLAYSKLDHSTQQPPDTSCISPTTGELYSSLEDSTAPIYHTLELTDTQSPVPTSPQRLFDDTSYANLCGKQPKSGEAVHPHYTGDYERAPDYISPSIPISGGNEAAEYLGDLGDYERDPNYQPPLVQKSKRPPVPHEYSTLRDSTLEPPGEYTRPQHWTVDNHTSCNIHKRILQSVYVYICSAFSCPSGQ